MKQITLPALLGLVLALGCGCNALFLRETERFSLTIEGKPDATEPVSGNFGYKQRVALIVPGRKQTTSQPDVQPDTLQAAKERALREAVSMISFYDFVKEPKSTWMKDVITIRTAFVTGDAASALTDQQAQEVYSAITAMAIPTPEQSADRAVKRADAEGNGAELRTLAGTPWARLTLEQKSRLGQITGQQSSYDEDSHNSIRKALGQ